MRLCPKCGKKCEEARCPEDGTATLVFAANPESRLAEGTEVNGRYRIRNMIGQGGFGAVYRATNIATDQDMAIKLLAVSLDSDDSDVIQRFFAEAQVTASLKHPNTIRVFDFGQTEGGALYIAMELLSGRPLNDVLKRRAAEGKSLTEEETIQIGVQVLRSLAEAHTAQLVHRDLKPHNVFLHEVEGDDPVVKVLDFGIAKRLGSNLTGTGKAFGTPSYMSPEQAQNQVLDSRSDLYSLSCVLFQCVTGRPPFDGDDPLAVLLAHVTKTPPDLRQVAATPVSEAFVRVIEKGMAKDPAARFSSAIEFRQALEATRRSRSDGDRAASSVAFAEAMQGPPLPSEDRTVAYGAPGEERTQAFPGLTPRGLTPASAYQSRPIAPLPRSPSSAGSAQSTRQRAVVVTTDAGETTWPEAADDVRQANSPKKALWIIGGVFAVLIAAIFAFGGHNPSSPKDAALTEGATAAADPKPPVAPTSPPTREATPGNAEPAPAVPSEPASVKAEPVVKAQEAAAKAQTVHLDSDPSGATVVVGQDTLGKTPLDVVVPPGGHVKALLQLSGHRDLEVEVTAADAPSKIARLTAVPGTKASGAIKKTGTGTGNKPSKDGSSSLDERI
jgi:serine/threonine protein kinase